jgi:hypothetical protein
MRIWAMAYLVPTKEVRTDSTSRMCVSNELTILQSLGVSLVPLKVLFSSQPSLSCGIAIQFTAWSGLVCTRIIVYTIF